MGRPTRQQLEAEARRLKAEIEQRTGRKVKSVEVTWTRTEQERRTRTNTQIKGK